MPATDHYTTLGLPRTANAADIKRAYRKLARKYHPDVSKEPNAEARFKDIANAHEALHTPELRAAYDEELNRPPPPERGPMRGERGGNGHGFSFDGEQGGDASELFESLFGRQGRRGPRTAMPGEDQHAQMSIRLEDSYHGGEHTVTLHVPVVDAQGRAALQARHLSVRIPRGAYSGQQLRLAGQGGPGHAGGPPGDLYLELLLKPHAHFRVEGREVSFNLLLAPWEAALGASVTANTPDGSVQLTIPAGSHAGRRLRLKGKGLPGTPPGDLYAVLGIALPAAITPEAKAAYGALATAFPAFDARTG